MDGNVQPPRVCQAIINAISTEAEELNPEPRGTSDPYTACRPGVFRSSSPSAHITPAGYCVHSASGLPSVWLFDGIVPGRKEASCSKSAATSVVRSEPAGENA